jgi:hypothetical protein
MNINLPLSMLRRITIVLDQARDSRSPVRVYAEAEKLQQLHPESNIALEDIVEQFVLMGANRGVAFEIDLAQATDAVMGTNCGCEH